MGKQVGTQGINSHRDNIGVTALHTLLYSTGVRQCHCLRSPKSSLSLLSRVLNKKHIQFHFKFYNRIMTMIFKKNKLKNNAFIMMHLLLSNTFQAQNQNNIGNIIPVSRVVVFVVFY